MKILITAGPTHEHIDPVRFITNGSTGIQGIWLAKAAARFTKGSEVVLIIGPTHIELPKYKNIKIIKVVSADEMYEATAEHFPECDIAIFSAAVSDYKPKTYSETKIKKSTSDSNIELVPNRDIAFEMGKIKRDEQTTIGFALETDNAEENARAKLVKKNFDFIVLNEINSDNPAFGNHHNRISIIDGQGNKTSYNKGKEQISYKILEMAYALEVND